MTTILEYAREGICSPQMNAVTYNEGINPEILRAQIMSGKVVIMHREKVAVGIGEGLRTKINVNLGSSTNRVRLYDEIEKARIAEKYGADTISDLSMGGDINQIRKEILSQTTLPVTTVPIYQAVAESGLKELTTEDILTTIHMQARQGVSSMVIHCVNERMLNLLREKKRILGMVSNGGGYHKFFHAAE